MAKVDECEHCYNKLEVVREHKFEAYTGRCYKCQRCGARYITHEVRGMYKAPIKGRRVYPNNHERVTK